MTLVSDKYESVTYRLEVDFMPWLLDKVLPAKEIFDFRERDFKPNSRNLIRASS